MRWTAGPGPGTGCSFRPATAPPSNSALGIDIAGSVEDAEPAVIAKALRARSRNLALVRASDVTFRMRSLGIGDKVLFGNDRIGNIDNWPVVATVQGPAGSAGDQKRLWTLVAGGDSFTDRGIYERVVNRNKGVDYPFDGGTARVTGHYCCGPFVDGYGGAQLQAGRPQGHRAQHDQERGPGHREPREPHPGRLGLPPAR